jgi:hypothetical protein
MTDIEQTCPELLLASGTKSGYVAPHRGEPLPGTTRVVGGTPVVSEGSNG